MKKVLIIEDDRWLADNYRLILEKNDWQARTTTLASEALDIIDDFQPNIVLLDFILPEKNAPTLLNELQSHTDTAELPIIICTSLSGEKMDASILRHYGVKAVIDKTTVTPDAMLKILDKFSTHAAA